MTDLDITVVPQQDPRLGRHKVHDPRSRSFARTTPVDTTKWRTKTVATYNPRPNPNQPNGCCVPCAKATRFNSRGVRVKGRVLDMAWVQEMYRLVTAADPFPGQFPPDDTGSDGLSMAKVARQVGIGGEFRWRFDGADGVVQEIVENDEVVEAGSWWYSGMMEPTMDSKGNFWIAPTGYRVGGHQYAYRGYNEPLDALVMYCMWGEWGYRGNVLIKREHANDLLMDEGDAHVQEAP